MFFWAKVVGGIALAIALAVGTHFVLEHFRQEGRDEVQAKWDADKLARTKLWSDTVVTLSNNWSKAKDEADANKLEADRQFDVIANMATRVHRGGGVAVPDDVVRVSSRATDFANRRSGGTPAETRTTGTAPVPEVSGTKIYDEVELAQFLTRGAFVYDDAVQKLEKCYKDEDALYAALVRVKGGNKP